MSHGDLRILLAAGAWWIATIGSLLLGAGPIVTIAVTIGGTLFCTYLVRRHFGRGKQIKYWTPTLLVIIAAVLLASGVTTAHEHLAKQGTLPSLIQAKAVVTIRGTIESYPNPAGDKVLVTMSVDEVEGRGEISTGYSTVMLVGKESLRELNLQETVSVLVRLEPTDRGSQTASWATVLAEPVLLKEAGPVSRWIAMRADAMMGHLSEELPQVRGLVPGLAIGDDSEIPEAHEDALAAVNLTHLTAVSGAHVSMICSIVLNLIGRKHRLLAVLGAAGVLGALILATGAQPSVMRAGVMGVVVLAGVWMRRPSSALPALGVSIVVLLATDPYLALAYGFILSVVSTAAIITWTRQVTALLAPVFTVPGANLLAVPIVAHLACAPIILMLSDTASLWSALANALVAPVVPAGTVFALAALICAPFPLLGPLLAWLAARCVSWIDIVAGELALWPGSGLPGELVILVYLVVLLLAWLLTYHRRTAYVVAAAGLGAMSMRFLPSSTPDWDIVACDVGQGAATLFRHRDTTYLVDTGTKGEGLEDCLKDSGAHVDVLILTHLHDDHAGEADLVIAGGTREVWVGPGIGPQLPRWDDVQVREVKAGDSPEGIDILWPERERNCTSSSCENDQSLVIKVDLGQTLLIPGDIELMAQSRLARADISSDIVLIPHHGSPVQDPEFARALGAHLAILSYGENSYGHPAPATIDLYATYGEIRTTEGGHIFLKIDDTK